MNQIYRVVFNTLTGAWQAVSEIARGRSKSSRSAPTAQRAAPGRNPQRPALHATAVLAAVLSICGMAQATPSEQYWDGGQTTANGTIDGGSGSWAAGTTNWTDANGNSNSAWAGGEAVFQGTAGTVQMNGLTATGLRFATDGYVLDVGVLNLASTATVQTDAGVTATLKVTLGSFGTVEKHGTGTLVLNGGNAATTTKLFEGTLVLGNNQALGAIGQLIVAGDNTTLDANTAVLLSNTIDLGSNTLTLGGSYDIKLSGTIMGSGALVKNGAADLMLSGSNNSTGGITLNEGTLIASSSFALGSGALTVGGNVNLDISSTAILFNAIDLSSGTLTFKGSNDTTLYGVISGSGALVKNGSTNLTLTGVNTYTGSTTVNSGTLAIDAGGSLSAVTALTVGSGATFDISASGSDQTVGSLAGAGTLALDSHTLSAGGNNQTTTFSGSIGGAGGLNKTGSGTLTLTGNNNYGGGTTVSGGTLVASVASLGSGAITNNATLELNQASNATLTKAISGTGQLSKTGAGTLTLKAANTYSGGTTIHSGTLAIGSGGSLAATGAVNLAGAGTFDMAAAGNQTIGALSGVAGSTVALGAYTLTMGAATNAIFSGSITGTYGSLVKNGGGVQTLNGASTYSGGTTISGGGLVVGNNAALGTGAVTVSGNATLDSNSAVTLGNHFTLNAGLTALGSNDLVLNGDLSGIGSLTKEGLATLTLNGTNTYTGNTFINAGTLALGAGASLAASGIVNLASGATFDLSAGAGTQTFGTLVGNGAVRLGANTLTLGDATNGTFNGSIAGSGSLIKEGTGTETLTGSHTFTGSTTINGGTLAIGAGGSLAATGVVTLANAGTSFDISAGGNQRIGSLAGVAGSAVALGGNTLTLDGVGNSTFNGSIDGTGALIKNGAGVQTLGGPNTFIGGVTLNAGGLVVGNNDALGSGTLVVAGSGSLDANAPVTLANSIALGAGANLDVRGSNDLTFAGAISGSGGLIKNGTATLTLDGASTYAGTTVINSGTLALGTNGALSTVGALNLNGATAVFDASAAATASTIGALSGVTGSRVVLGSQTLTFGDATSTTFAGVFNGSSTLTKQGSGTLTLAGDSSAFTGSTTVQAGSLQLNNAQLGGALTLTNGTTLAGTGSVGSLGSTTLVRSGATISPGSAGVPGTLTVQGDLTFEQGAAYEVQVDPNSTASSLLDVKGRATLAGSVLHVGAGGSFSTAQTYAILRAGSLSGQFDTVASNFAYLDTKLSYIGNDVTLQLQRKSSGGGSLQFVDLADTANQAGVARGIESLSSGHPLFQYIENLHSGAPQAEFNHLSGDAHANVSGSLPGLGAYAPSVSQQHLRNNMTAGFRAGAPVAQSDGPLPASAWPSSKALPAWAEVVGHWQSYDGDGNAATLKQRTTGLFLGMDQEVGSSGWRLGGSLGYTNADSKVANRASESDVNSYSAAVYGGKSFGTGVGPRINVLGGLAYTWHDIATTRRIESLGQTLKADYSAHTAQLFAEVGYAIGQYDKFGFEPFVGVSLGQQRTGSFQERGGFAALSGQSNTDDLASTTLGLRVHSDFQVAGKDARVRATVGWRHAFGDVATSKTMAFEGGQNFTVAGSPLARNTAVLGLEGEVALSRTAALVLGYRGELGSGQRDHAANVKLRWAF